MNKLTVERGYNILRCGKTTNSRFALSLSLPDRPTLPELQVPVGEPGPGVPAERAVGRRVS